MNATGLVIFGLVSLLALVSLLPPLAARLRLPYSVLLAAIGCLLGLVVWLRPDQAIHAPMLEDLVGALASLEISADAFIAIFLPTLLFESALAIDVRRLMDDLAPVLALAVLAVFICAGMVGFALNWVAPYGFVACLLLGSIVATTDPAAVIGAFREVGAPKRMTTLVEGESLLNDAAAIALFVLLLGMLTGDGSRGIGSAISLFLVDFLGGLVAGYVLALLACLLLALIRGWPMAEVTLTIALAYLSYLIADHYLHVSGVVACVTAGLVMGSLGRTHMSPEAHAPMEGAWGQLGFWANSLIFLLAAMFVPRIMRDMGPAEIGFILVIYLATLVARGATIFGLLPMLTRLGLMQRIENRIKAVILWGGLRGAVSLTLALAITENEVLDLSIRNFIATSVAGFVLMTLFINGTTLRSAVTFFQLNRLSPVARIVRDRAQAMALGDIAGEVADIASQERIDSVITDELLATLKTRRPAAERDLSLAETIKVGLTVITAYESQHCFDLLKARIVDRHIAERLLREAQRLRESVRVSDGAGGFVAAAEQSLGYSGWFRLALWAQRYLSHDRLLADALADRFEFLMNQRLVLSRIVPLCRSRLRGFLGEAPAGEIERLFDNRAKAVETALNALRLQYPVYATALQRQYLGRIARDKEAAAYRALAHQRIISGEVERDLMREVDHRWPGIDRRLRLDPDLAAADMIQRVPLFHDLDPDRRAAIVRLLHPILAVPGQTIVRRGEAGNAMYFIASGAVRVERPEKSVELGSGDFFGELALVTGQARVADVVGLGFCRLLCLKTRDFQRLLEQDISLKNRIEAVARERQWPNGSA